MFVATPDLLHRKEPSNAINRLTLNKFNLGPSSIGRNGKQDKNEPVDSFDCPTNFTQQQLKFKNVKLGSS